MTLVLSMVLLCLLPSFLIAKLPVRQWYAQICMSGVRKLGYSMSKLGRKEPNKVQWWEPAFVFYWSVITKYFIPAVLWILLVNNVMIDVVKRDSDDGLGFHWDIIGLTIPLLGLGSFLINICFCLHDEPLDMDDYKERFDQDFVDSWDEYKIMI